MGTRTKHCDVENELMRTDGVRRLIINADDLGFTSGVNPAIVEAYTQGIVTSSTLMANGPAFAQAATLAKTVPSLSVGCHVVLIDGAPLLPARRIPSLAARNSIPMFHAGLKSFAACALVGRIDDDEITAEAAAQIRRVQEAGIRVTHFDTHKHTHLFPKILRPLLRAARICGVKALRNPFGPRFPFQPVQLLKRPNLWTRYAEVRFLSPLARYFREAVSREGFVAPDGTLGIEVTGALDESLFRAIAAKHPERHMGIRVPSWLQRRRSARRKYATQGIPGNRAVYAFVSFHTFVFATVLRHSIASEK